MGSICFKLNIWLLYDVFVCILITLLNKHSLNPTEQVLVRQNTLKWSLHLAADAFWILTGAVWMVCLASTQEQTV